MAAIDYSRLQSAVEWSRRQMAVYREKYTARIKTMVGRNYSDDGAALQQPVNFIELAVGIYTRQIAARNPVVAVKPRRDSSLKPYAKVLTAEVNACIERSNLSDTIQRWTKGALLGSMSVVKCSLADAGTAEIDGRKVRKGVAFQDVVSLDNFVIDMNETRWDRATFMGDFYRLPLRAVKASGLYKNTENLAPTPYSTTDEDGNEKAQTTGRGAEAMDFNESYLDFVSLLDVWLPLEGKVCTFAVDDQWRFQLEGKPIRTVNWTGPRDGPYHYLSFGEVPDNIMSLPPMAMLEDLNTAGNILYRKMLRQAERQKTMIAARGDKMDELNRVLKASDGEAIRMDDPTSVQPVNVPGVDKSTVAFWAFLKNDLNFIGGNLEQLGGLGVQAGTLGQEEILANAASQRVQDMQKAAERAVKKLVTSLAHYYYHDPLKDDVVFIRIPNSSIEIEQRVTAGSREGSYSDYDFNVTPYSMQDRTPMQTMGILNQVLNTLAPMMQIPGINVGKLIDMYADFANLPELKDVWNAQTPDQMMESPARSHEASPMAQNTTRRYIREGRPGGSRMGRENNLAMTMMGSDANPTDNSV